MVYTFLYISLSIGYVLLVVRTITFPRRVFLDRRLSALCHSRCSGILSRVPRVRTSQAGQLESVPIGVQKTRVRTMLALLSEAESEHRKVDLYFFCQTVRIHLSPK